MERLGQTVETLWRTAAAEASWTAGLDILVVALMFYGVYRLIQETRAIRILYGIGILVGIYGLSQALGLVALGTVLRSTVTVALVAIPVVFQPELRAALERLGRGQLVRGVLGAHRTTKIDVIGAVSRAITTLARQRTGALLVLEQETGLKDLVALGVPLDARPSPELLVALFAPISPLHDGAVVIHGGRVSAARVFLPLTEAEVDRTYGTRHRAALGLAEATDAIVIVVSEERGTITVAHQGKLVPVEAPGLDRRLRQLVASGVKR